MKRILPLSILGAACAAGTLLLAAACDSTSDTPHDNPSQLDAAIADSAAQGDTGVTILPDGAVVVNDSAVPPGSDCFTNPKTHFEIINACTDAQRIDKHPTLPLLLPDGGLPPPP